MRLLHLCGAAHLGFRLLRCGSDRSERCKRLVYLDGGKLVRLTLEQARTLSDAEAGQA